MSRIRKTRGTFRPIMSLGLILFVMFLSGCEVLATQGAREAIAGQREVRALEDQELGPLQRELHDLLVTEIQPRESQIEVLRYQLESLEEDLLRPLWEAQDDGWAPGGEAYEAQLVFDRRFRELELMQRSIEKEQHELDSKWQDLWGVEGNHDPEFQALEDLRYEKQRELDQLYRFGNRPIEDIWNEINELNSTQNWGNTDAQIRSEEINAELNRLYDRYTEIQHTGNGEASLLDEKARSIQDQLEGLHNHGRDQINKIHAEIEQLEFERTGLVEAAGNNESINAHITELERRRASYVESRDAEVASLMVALAAIEEERIEDDASTAPSDENAVRIAELEGLIADLEAQSAALLASNNSEIDSLSVQIDEVNASFDQLIADATAESQALSDSLVTQADQLGAQIDELNEEGGDDSVAQIPALQAQKDALDAQLEAEKAALDETVGQLKNDDAAAVDELQSLRQVLEAAVSNGLTDAIDAQIAVYEAELNDLRTSNEGTAVQVSNTTSSEDIKANIEASENYWDGLINEATIEILELQSQLSSITVDDSAGARIKNLQLQASELEQELNARIADLEATIKELYRQANNAGSGGSVGLAELQSQIDALNYKLESVWQDDSSKGLDILRRVQTLEEQARALSDEFQLKTRALEEELWVLDDRLKVFYRQQESDNRLIKDGFEAEMALLQQRRTDLDEQRWAIELEARTVRDEIEAKNAATMEEIKRIENGLFRDLKTQIRELELELRGLYGQQREIEFKMDDARELIEDKQRELEDNVLDLLDDIAGALDAPGEPTLERPADTTFEIDGPADTALDIETFVESTVVVTE